MSRMHGRRASRRVAMRSLPVAAILACALAAHAARAEWPAQGDLVFAHGFDRPVLETGGSVYLWYHLGAGCDREPYGILLHYAVPGVRTTVRQQLAAMHATGQRRLAIGQHFGHGISTGTILDAADPSAVSLVAANLATFLADIEWAGFDEVLFRLYPQGNISPSSENFDRDLIDAYWNLVVALRPPLASGSIDYRLDLFVEGMPRDRGTPWPPGTPVNEDWSEAVRWLWQQYTANFGAADSIGFSFLLDDDRDRLRMRVRHMDYVYQGNPPDTIGLDVYAGSSLSESDKVVHFAKYASQFGYQDLDWIIPEVHYEDPVAAEGISSAIAAVRPTVRWLSQWPWDRADLSCGPTPHVNVPPPFEWTVWGGYGF